MNSPTNLCLLLCVSILFSSCASTKFADIEGGSSFEYVVDEKNLWKQCEEIQDNLVNSTAIYPDEQLDSYVNAVLKKLIAGREEAWGADIKAYIVYDSDFNAMMFPNGFMIVHTGLLAHLDNEAQLATILGHELTHFLHRHSLKQQNNLVNITAFLSALRVAAVGASCGLAYSGYDPTAISTIHDSIAIGLQGAFYGYSRSAEFDADNGGFNLIKETGYDVNEAKVAMENMLAATELIEKKNRTPYFYSSHPKTKLRIKNYAKFIKSLSKEVDLKVSISSGEKEYMSKIKDLLIDNLALDIKKKNIKLANRQLEKYVEAYSEDYKSLYFSGLLLMREGEKEEAITKFSRSKELNPNYSAALKELGILLYKKGEKVAAKENFKKYLVLEPSAKDAEFIRGYIDE